MIEMSMENEISVEEKVDSVPPEGPRAGDATSLADCSPSASHRTKPGGDGVNYAAPSSGASLGPRSSNPERGPATRGFSEDPASAVSDSVAVETKAQERRGVEEEQQRVGQLLKPKNGLQQQQHNYSSNYNPNQAQKQNKRRNSVNIGFKHPGCKRRRRANSESDPVLPTNFLLGGNIFDPLNLNSLLDEEVNRALNAETPKSSPLPPKNREEPVEILIPKDITDPLNLNCGSDAGILVSPVKGGGGRKRHRHRHHGGGGGGGAGVPPQTQTQTQTQSSGSLAPEQQADTAGDKARRTPPVAAVEGSAIASLNHPLHNLPPPPPPSSVSDSLLCPPPPPAAPPPSSVLSATSAPPSSSSSSSSPPSARPVQQGGPGATAMTKPTLQPHPLSPSPRASLGSAPAAAGSSSPPSSGVPEPYELNTSINCRDEVVPPLLPAAASAPSAGAANNHRRSSAEKNKPSSQPPNSHSSSCGPSSRSRKRRRVSSSKPETVGSGGGEREKKLTPEKGKAGEGGGGGGGGGTTVKKQLVANKKKPGSKHKQRKFQYGNYNKYYGYRNPGLASDPRAGVLKPEWFRGKAVLDLGCNAGHLTLAIARDCGPARIVGVDIDGGLIHCARQNIRHYLSEQAAGGGPPGRRFPDSLAVCHGPIAAPPVCGERPGATGEFPDNVSFLQCNYVLQQDDLLLTQKPEYDVILCLSVSKWVHLNWGDDGLKRLFKRVYRHLQPGGVFILEPQPWTSYGKRKKLTETIYSNYYSIRLKPEQFSSYLVSPEVGFSSYELLGTPDSAPKGFQRPIYLYHKGLASVEK